MANQEHAESAWLATRFGSGPAVDSPPLFGAVEREVIALAVREAERWLRLPSLVVRALGRLLDLSDATPLANRQLEALRRFVVRTRLAGGLPPPGEVEHLLSEGFTPIQVRALTAPLHSVH